MFKPSSRCVAPHVNLEILRNKLFVAQVCDTLGATSAEKLVSIIESVSVPVMSKTLMYVHNCS